MLAQEVVDNVQNYLRNLKDQGFPVSFAVVFGSQVKGNSHEWSDIDLLVVSPRFDEDLRRDDINRLWRVAARTDSRIEPVPCGARQWVDDTSRAVIEIARREGTRVLAGGMGVTSRIQPGPGPGHLVDGGHMRLAVLRRRGRPGWS